MNHQNTSQGNSNHNNPRDKNGTNRKNNKNSSGRNSGKGGRNSDSGSVDGFGSGGGRGRNPQQWQPGSWMQWAPWTCPPSPYPSYNNWARPTFTPPPQHGLLGPKPQQPAYNANAPSPTDIEAALHTLSLTPPDLSWYMDTGATSHMTSAEGNLSSYSNLSKSRGIIVGNGHSIPIRGFGSANLPHPHPPLVFENVLHAPNSIKNLVLVRKFTTDNQVSIEFDPFGFSVKDFQTGMALMRYLNPHLDHTQHLPLPPIFQPTSSSANKPVTRSQHGIYRPNTKYHHGLNANVTKSPLPRNPVSALRDPKWKMAMDDEHIALIKNNTWDLVPHPPDANVIRSMWIFRHKEKFDVSFERHKARLVCDGAGQQFGMDCGETFSPSKYDNSLFIYKKVTQHASSLFLPQKKYAEEIIERAGMSSCKPCPTPVDTKPKLSAKTSIPYEDPSQYRSLAGDLQYLTFTRLDISYAVQQICLFIHNLMDDHMHTLMRILRYVQGTLHFGLHLYPSSTLISYTDADWGGCPDTRLSTSGYCVFLRTTSSLGLLNDNPHSLAPVLRPNTEALPMWFLSHASYAVFFWSYIVLSIKLHWSTVIMLA
uniref:Reverse transcriptase Ty1/copia-type domain-containing protein n=1 Tax=Cannabis sativa TaxID=3483 RepID=A0A803P4X6_CANSA